MIRQFEAVGIEPEKLIAQGFGSSRPDVANHDDKGNDIKENQALNRRVVIKVQFVPQKETKDDVSAEYFEKVQKAKQAGAVKVAGSEVNGEAAAPASEQSEVEKKIQEAQSRLEEAQKRAKIIQEEERKQRKLAELEKKLEQLKQKTVEVETKTGDKKPASVS